MKKLGRFILSLFIVLCIFTFPVLAEESFDEELYKRQYEISGADALEDLIPDDANEILKSLEVTLENPNKLFSPKVKNILAILWEFVLDGMKNPLKTALSIIGVLLIFASFNGIATQSNNMATFVCFVASVIATEPIFAVMESVKIAVQSLSTFMLGLVPVYTAVMLSMGKVTSAGGFSTLLLSASEGVSYLISYCFLPLSGSVLCLGICGGISPIPVLARLAGWIKKSANWAMGIATTLFLSILSLQNSFSSVTDGLAMRTSKAMLSTAIPIMGPAIAETINTARGCMALLKSGIGIYAVLAVIVIALPTAIQLVLWRVSMWISAGTAEIFGMKEVEGLLRSVDYCISVLLSAVCFMTLLFVISLAIGTGAG
jgi:stage III sporulation protein AE